MTHTARRKRPRPALALVAALAGTVLVAAKKTPAPSMPYPTEPLPALPPSTPYPTEPLSAAAPAGVGSATAWPTPSRAVPPPPATPRACVFGPAAAPSLAGCPTATVPAPSLRYCMLPPGACADVPTVGEWAGTCAPVPAPGTCGEGVVVHATDDDGNADVVCGCDGMTYADACHAAVAGASVRRAGQCETSAPTGGPSLGPAPTRDPTATPTADPTPQPTRFPTRFPTRLPTRLPTRYPSLAPATAGPTAGPTADPTTATPSNDPTPRPTSRPTEYPTEVPTRVPSEMPTEVPTALPSEVPTSLPSEMPMRKPTRDPTQDPTKDPTTIPSWSPTPWPSRRPTPSPTSPPSAASTTALPTELPTARPTRYTAATEGTARPTDALWGPTRTAGLGITLSGISGLENARRWERTTARFYERVYDESPDVAVDEVEVAITSMKATTAARRGRRARGLRQDAAVEVIYTQTTSYRSNDPTLTIEDIARIPLSTDLLRDKYIKELKDLDGYEQLTAVSGIIVVSDGGDGDQIVDGADAEGGGKLPLGAILGIVGGGLALAVLAAGFLYARRRQKDNGSYDPAGATAPVAPDVRTAASGGGTGGTNASLPTYGDGSVATVDYDYSRADGGAGDTSLSEAGGTLGSRTRLTAAEDAATALPPRGGPAPAPPRPGSGHTLFSDDPTFDRAYEDVREELLDVYAPAGKLGVVIDTPDDGAPVVHAVKDASPVADRVKVGDKLVAVDDEDVRAMTAIKVSKLISRKSSNASRKLTIIRHVPVGG